MMAGRISSSVGFAAQLACALVLAVPIATGAFAQSDAPTGSRISGPKRVDAPSRLTPAEVNRQAMIEYGVCAVKQHTLLANKLAQMSMQERDYQTKLHGLGDGICVKLEGQIALPHNIMRGAMFIGLYRTEFGRNPPSRAIPPTPIAIDMSIATGSLREFGNCVVTRDSDNARKLVMSNVATPAELAAFEGLQPSLSACLKAGEKVALSKSVLIAIVAEMLYLNAKAAS